MQFLCLQAQGKHCCVKSGLTRSHEVPGMLFCVGPWKVCVFIVDKGIVKMLPGACFIFLFNLINQIRYKLFLLIKKHWM